MAGARKEKALRPIAELVPDAHNANRGTDRGRRMLSKSLEEYGAGRSILIDKSGKVIAGNKTLEQAKLAGHKQILVVPSDGKTLIAVQRTDLDLKDTKAKALALADNRVAEIDLAWDAVALDELAKDIDLEQFFTEDELAAVLTETPRLTEREKELRPKKMVRILVSVPVGAAGEAKECFDKLAEIEGIEIDFSAN